MDNVSPLIACGYGFYSVKEAVCDIITRKDNPSLKEEEDEGEEGKDKAMPNKQRDDLALRRGQSRPLPQRDGPMSFVSSSMSPSDVQKWERLRMTEPRCQTHCLYESSSVLYVRDVLSGEKVRTLY